MVNVNIILSIIKIKVNELNFTPVKKQRLSDQVKKQDSTISYLPEACFRLKDINTL